MMTASVTRTEGQAVSSPQPTTQTPQSPPDEEFWEKYSPRHEFGLAWVGSIAFHVGLFLLFLFCINMLGGDDAPEAPPMRPVTVEDPNARGILGGGSDKGGTLEDVPEAEQFKVAESVPEPRLREITDVVQNWSPDQKIDPKMIEDLARSPNFDKLARAGDALRKALMPGQGGLGGTDGGNSNGFAPNSTAGRAIRWSLNFQVESSDEWLRQFAALKATLMFPIGASGEAVVIRDPLKPDEKERLGNFDSLKELYFIDDKPRSVRQVALACRLDFTPSRFVAFFPKAFENRLAEEERKFRNRKEEEIVETDFRISIRNGEPVITVISQQAKR
jgi:hypothetical protein